MYGSVLCLDLADDSQSHIARRVDEDLYTLSVITIWVGLGSALSKHLIASSSGSIEAEFCAACQ